MSGEDYLSTIEVGERFGVYTGLRSILVRNLHENTDFPKPCRKGPKGVHLFLKQAVEDWLVCHDIAAEKKRVWAIVRKTRSESMAKCRAKTRQASSGSIDFRAIFAGRYDSADKQIAHLQYRQQVRLAGASWRKTVRLGEC